MGPRAVGEHVAQEDAERPRARGLGGGDVELAAGLEGLGAGQPDHLRRRRDGDGGDHAGSSTASARSPTRARSTRTGKARSASTTRWMARSSFPPT